MAKVSQIVYILATLFCHQRGSQSSYGALVRCIKILSPRSIDSTWSRGLIRSIFPHFPTCFRHVSDFVLTFFQLFSDHRGIIWGPSGDHLGVIRGSSGGHPGTLFRLFFNIFLTFFRLFSDHLGTIRGPSGDHPGPPPPSLLSAYAGFMVFCVFPSNISLPELLGPVLFKGRVLVLFKGQ